MIGLFGDDVPTKRTRARGLKFDAAHAATPGTGPVGEPCGSCAHYRSLFRNVKRYRKCGLLERTWTHGPGTDIRAHDAACRKWEAPK